MMKMDLDKILMSRAQYIAEGFAGDCGQLAILPMRTTNDIGVWTARAG